MGTTSGSSGSRVSGNQKPVAIIAAVQQQAVVGAIIKLDGRLSYDPDDGTVLAYRWSFKSLPIGSFLNEGSFYPTESDSSSVTFTPDVSGSYEVCLVVNDGIEDSDPAYSVVNVVQTLVPYNRGVTPDLSYLWKFLSNFWSVVEDRKKIEMLWTGVFQAVAADLLTLFQYEYNKSISTIQPVRHRKWLSYAPPLDISSSKLRIYLTEDQAGTEAASDLLDTVFYTPSDARDFVSSIRVPLSEGRFDYSPLQQKILQGRLLSIGDSSFVVASAFTSKRSINSGTDGSVAAASYNFYGSDFSDDQVGCYLVAKIGDDVKRSLIQSVNGIYATLADQLSQTDQAGITYSVLSAEDYYAVANTRDLSIPGSLRGSHWRLSSTIVSDDIDFEAAGVSPGDYLEVAVNRLDIGVTGTFLCAVVGVNGNKLSFVLNPYEVIDGTPNRKLSDSAILSLSVDLQVPGLAQDSGGTILYSGEAEMVRNTLSSVKWKRSLFETELTSSTVIDVGPFTVTVRPMRILRTRRIPVDGKVISIPRLSEFINPVNIGETDEGPVIITPDGETVSYDHIPRAFDENKDFIIDDGTSIITSCTITAGQREVKFPGARLLDRSISVGDSVVTDLSDTSYKIYRVLTNDSALVVPTPTISGTSKSSITRAKSGKFIRFPAGTFSASQPPPSLLWAEVTFFDNWDIIEANFGSLVGFSYEELRKRGSTIPYISIVSGLMYFLTSGKSLNDARLAAQVLFGLPFSRTDGILSEINTNYKHREDGSPEYSRLVIDETVLGQKTGRRYVYLVPYGPQVVSPLTSEWTSTFPDLAGIAINPETGLRYEVGDRVKKYAILSNGVVFGDYISDDPTVKNYLPSDTSLEKYHSFTLGVYLDLVHDVDIDLAAEFLVKERLQHTKLVPVGILAREDEVVIEDDVEFVWQFPFFDNPGLPIPTAIKFDDDDTDGSYLSVDGLMHFSHYGVNSTFGDYMAYGSGITFVSGNDYGTLSGALTDYENVAVGDELYLIYGGLTGVSHPYVVTGMHGLTLHARPKWDRDGVHGFMEASGSYAFVIIRRALLCKSGLQLPGLSYSLTASGISGGDVLTFSSFSNPTELALFGSMCPGDLVTIASRDYTITHIDGPNLRTHISPTLPSDLSNEVATFQRRKPLEVDASVSPPAYIRPSWKDTQFAFDMLDMLPEDTTDLRFIAEEGKIVYNSGSSGFTSSDGEDFSALNVLPGSFIQILEGPDSTLEIGYGPGMIPVKSVSGVLGEFCVSMANSSPATGYSYAIVRRL